MVDNVIVGKTRTRRQYSSFYTDSIPILSYMTEKLAVSDGDIIMEPCAGSGLFINHILDKYPGGNYKVTAYDLNPKAVESLNSNIGDNRVEIIEADTLFDKGLDEVVAKGGKYNKVIGNPPYGAWQDLEKRELLKGKYGGYVKETYTLFIRRCLDAMTENGKLVFIVPDTFLALSMHKQLRKYLLENTYIEEICMFPSKFFPGVNFGYSNLCIITLVKTSDKKNEAISLVTITDKPEILLEVKDGDYTHAIHATRNQYHLLADKDYSFMIGADEDTAFYLKSITTTLGDMANCVTGFYSGDNQTFLSVESHKTASLQKYKVVNDKEVEQEWTKVPHIIDGLDNGKKYIPFLKGGPGVFRRPTTWFVEWTKEAVNHYKTDKKARFQNSKYYFGEGIAVPMVRGKKLRATLIERRLFDQSVVGIFPKDEADLYYLLAFLNSDICTKILSSINHTANNSANYLKKIPVINSPEIKSQITKIMNRYFENGDAEAAIVEVNKILDTAYSEIALKRA